MGMQPDDFYRAFVEENYYDFNNEPDNVRKGINAAVSAFHMSDQYFNYYKKMIQVRLLDLRTEQIF